MFALVYYHAFLAVCLVIIHIFSFSYSSMFSQCFESKKALREKRKLMIMLMCMITETGYIRYYVCRYKIITKSFSTCADKDSKWSNFQLENIIIRREFQILRLVKQNAFWELNKNTSGRHVTLRVTIQSLSQRSDAAKPTLMRLRRGERAFELVFISHWKRRVSRRVQRELDSSTGGEH